MTSRTSTLRYKGARKPVAVIAEDLGVDAIVEGAVMHSGQRVRIMAQLIQADDDRLLLSEEYDRDLSDILTLQSEVAQAIADRIEIKLSAQHRQVANAHIPRRPALLEASSHHFVRSSQGPVVNGTQGPASG